jgi:hypothetical protein
MTIVGPSRQETGHQAALEVGLVEPRAVVWPTCGAPLVIAVLGPHRSSLRAARFVYARAYCCHDFMS